MKEEVKARLVRHVKFLEQELGDFPSFRGLTWDIYRSDSVNSSIDVSKLILLAHEYLDVRWASIERFIREAESVYEGFLEGVKRYLRRNL